MSEFCPRDVDGFCHLGLCVTGGRCPRSEAEMVRLREKLVEAIIQSRLRDSDTPFVSPS